MADKTNGGAGPPKPTGKKELSMEVRLLVAFILMGAVLFLTPYIYKPAVQPRVAPPSQTPQTARKAAETPPSPPAALPVPGQLAADREQETAVSTELYEIRFSNRGGVVRSWILKKFKDDTGKPLQLVNVAAGAKAGWPFSVVLRDQAPGINLDQALFVAKPSADGLSVEFEFSDGKVFCRKSFQFGRNSYLTRFRSELRQSGALVPHLLAWRGGFGDAGVDNAAAFQHAVYYDVNNGKLVLNEAKAAKNGPVTAEGHYSFAGIQDTYFAAVFLPGSEANTVTRTFSDNVPDRGGKEQPHVGAAAGGSGVNTFALFVGPKDLDLLRTVEPKLVQLVDFGWFTILAKPLFYSLNWVNDKLVRNYGWSIVLVTVVINFLLLPLKMSSMKSMKKMGSLQPEIAAINEKYRSVGLRDPRKAQQNEELMALYKKHGVNPLGGGCLPMLLQIPFFFAFYKVLTVAIEMRGAQWLWVADLSRPETLPIRILPVTMIATQFVLQKMTPSTTADPAQQRVMMFMPLMLGFMFYGVSSGLVLYWLTGNLVGIAQQWFFNRMGSAPAPPPKPVTKKKSSRN